jgi:hypothetical protein
MRWANCGQERASKVAVPARDLTSYADAMERRMDKLVRVVLSRVVDAIEQYLNATRVDPR